MWLNITLNYLEKCLLRIYATVASWQFKAVLNRQFLDENEKWKYHHSFWKLIVLCLHWIIFCSANHLRAEGVKVDSKHKQFTALTLWHAISSGVSTWLGSCPLFKLRRRWGNEWEGTRSPLHGLRRWCSRSFTYILLTCFYMLTWSLLMIQKSTFALNVTSPFVVDTNLHIQATAFSFYLPNAYLRNLKPHSSMYVPLSKKSITFALYYSYSFFHWTFFKSWFIRREVIEEKI